MAIKKATYVEPSSYFNVDMKKAYDDAKKKKAAKDNAVKTSGRKGK